MRAKAHRHDGTKARSRRAFTLTELMIAVAVLIVVIIATSSIFGTASRITALGQATSAVMTEGATIERMMREDIEKLTTEGFFAIRCAEVRNDVNGSTAPLLDPNRPATDVLRADQLVFFANGTSPMQSFRPSAGSRVRAQGVTSRVYWGPAFQLRNGSPVLIDGTSSSGLPNKMHAHDPIPSIYNPASNPFPAPTPWHRTTGAATNITMGTNLYGTFTGAGTSGGGTDMFGSTTPAAGPPFINGTQPDARQWLLARQNVILMDDDDTNRNLNSKTVVFTDHVTARSIFVQNNANAPWGWSREIRNGRLDAAASRLDDIRKWVTYNNSFFIPAITDRRPWSGAANDQRTIIQGAVYYPRAERKAPSANRVDQALTNHVIGTACSSFAIDWTYDDGVGYAENSAGTQFLGVQINRDIEQPWFGLFDGPRGVMRYMDWSGGAQTIMPMLTFPNNIESETVNTATLRDYWAIFGYNQTQALDPATGLPWVATGLANNAYTPFPSAIRVTMTLHDPEGKLEGGREFQFVIRLPRRNQ